MSAFRAEFKDSSLFKKIVESLRTIIDKTNFDCNDTTINVQCMDNTHSSLVSLEIKNDAFESYDCKKPITMGINLENLAKILKTIDSDQKTYYIPKVEKGDDKLKLKDWV